MDRWVQDATDPVEKGAVLRCCPLLSNESWRRQGKRAGKVLCLLLQQDLLSSHPRVSKVTLSCSPSSFGSAMLT